jgi:glycerol-3-phosphate dehydrogenase
MLKAMNVVTRREAAGEALAGRAPSGRHLFLVPWHGRALFGTWQSARTCAPDDTEVVEQEVAAFLADLNHAFPSLDLTLADVTLVHRGVVPAVATGSDLSLEGRDRIFDHRSSEVEGLLTVIGSKYTTARAVAERVTDHVLTALRRPPVACRTAEIPLPGGDLLDPADTVAEARQTYDTDLPADTIPHLVAAYGTRYRRVLESCRGRPDWRTRVANDSPVIGAELAWAAREEMTVTLCDAVIRRTPLGVLGYPGDAAVLRAASLVGTELGWSSARQHEEMTTLRQFYGSLNASNT